MPGTILLDDLRDSIGQQLGDYASGLTQAATAAVQPIAAAIPTPQTPDPNAILQELQQHAAAAAQAAQEQVQPALQVLGGAQQAAGGAVTQLGQTKDQIEQQLQQHAQTVADTSQQLGDHVNNIISGTVQGGQQALQSLATPPPTLGAVNDRGGISTDQGTPTLGGTTGAVSANAPGTAPTNAPPPDRSMSYQDYARAAAVRAGIDPNIFVAQIQQESGFTPTARSGAGAIGIAQFMPATAQGMNVDPTDPYASLDAAASLDAQNLKKYNGDYSKALAAYNAGGGAVDQYGGVPPYKETQTYVSTILNNARQSPSAPTPPQQTTAQARASDLGYTDISQFGDKQLSNDEAYAACGPAAAVRFAERFGRNPTLREATDLAKQVGWTASGGMAGITSEQQLLKNMGVDTHVVAPDWDAIAKEAQTGNPVTISTPGHYYFADGYNAETGAFHVGQSGLDLKNGSEWMTPAQMESLMGKAQGALFADNPNVPARGAAPVALGGTTGTQNAPITLGGPAPARAPLYADTNQPATPIQSAADVVGGAASALGTAAQQALAQAQEINRIQPGTEALKAATPVLGGAVQSGTAAVNQVAQDVQNAAQGVLGAAQDVNRLTPGATAVQAAAPVLGAAASDVGAGARAAADTAGQTLGGLAGQAHQQIVDAAQTPAGQALIQAGVQNATDPSLLPAGSRQLYQQISDAKNQWIDQNNPLRDVPFPVVAGLVSGIAQQLTDPIALATFGPTVGVGEAAGARVGAGLTGLVAERLSPAATRFVAQVGDKLTSGAIVGGLQNGLMAAEQPDATPQSVGEAVLLGAGLGAAVDVGGAVARPLVTRVGQMVIDRAAEVRPQLAALARSRQPAQADINFAGAGIPGAIDRLRGGTAASSEDISAPVTAPTRTPISEGGLGTPQYGDVASTPEGTIAQRLRAAAVASPDGVAHLSSDEMGQLPGLPNANAPLMTRGKNAGQPNWQQGAVPALDDLRRAVDTGLPQSRWYTDFAQNIANVVGQDNINEFAALFGITSARNKVDVNTAQALGLMRMARDFQEAGTAFTPENMQTWMVRNPILKGDGTPGEWAITGDKLDKIQKLYTTGQVDMVTNAKTASYAQNVISALRNRFDPNSTMDTWMNQLFNYRSSKDAAQQDSAYRAMRAVTDHLSGELGMVPHQTQAAAWFAIKAVKDAAGEADAPLELKNAVADFENGGKTTLGNLIDLGNKYGAYDAPEGTWADTAARPMVAHQLDQLTPESLSRAAPDSAQGFLNYPGKTEPVSGRVPFPVGPSSTEARRAIAEAQAPVVAGGISDAAKTALGYDQNTRQFRALNGVPHEVQGDQVLVPGGNMDTLRYVAARIGSASGDDAAPATLHQFDPTAPGLAGWRIKEIPHGARGELVNDLTTAGIGHQVLSDGTIRANALPVASDAHMEALAAAVEKAGAKVEEINGRIQTIRPEDYQSTLSRFGDRYGGSERSGVPEGGRGVADTAQAGAGAATEGGPGAAPAGRGLRGARELTPPLRTLYHGTSADYPSVEPGQRTFEGQNSLGPGHYLATDPGVASAYAERAQNPESIEGFQGQGANVRKVNVPADMRLFNITQTDRDMAAPEITRIADVLERQGGVRAGEAVNELRYLAGIADPSAKLGGDASPNAVFDAMASRGVEPRTISFLLRQLGYEGIEHIDSLDGAHNVLVFPEATNRLQNAISGRLGGQAQVPFGINLAGGVAGGYAGNLATPQDASPEERLRNIGLGATAGLLGTSALTRALERGRLVPEGARPGAEGFRAPETRPTLEDQILQARARGEMPGGPPQEPGRPVEGLPGVTQRTVRGAEPPNVPAGTSISDVHSNPHLLNEAGAGETPMTLDERSDYGDTLQQRYQANQDRLAAIDEQLRNPNQKPERPPWGGGWTNAQLVTLAKRQGLSAYEPLWWEKAGLMSGSGEVREDVGQSGLARGMGRGGREPTPQELRQERNTIAVDQRDLEAAGEQQATAPDNARFARRTQTTADLPFAGGEESAPHGPYATEQASSGPGSLAEDIVTQNGRKSYGDPLSGDGLREAPGEVVGTKGGITGTGISDINAEAVRPGEPSAETLARMPNLDAMLKGDMPEVKAQIQRAAEDNPALFDAYRQGRISHDSLVTDLATKVGMTREQWLKTPVGKGFNQDEMVALQAAAIDGQARSEQMAKDIAARGGVDALSPEQVAYGLNELVSNTRLLSVARGGRSTAGRTLNALKIKLDATMARGITASNDRIAATRAAAVARAAVKRATQVLEGAKQLDAEKNGVVNRLRKGEFDAGPAATPPTTEAEQVAARERGYENIPEERRGPVGPGTPTEMPGTPPRRAKVSNDIINQIADAYDQLDRYNAMTLHEKADVQAKLQAERDANAAKRKAAVREPPQELLAALKKELAWEQNNFAKRKDTWETMAFWDSKANENVATKRNAFRGGLYIEQFRKSADLAAKSAEADAKRAFNLESKRQSIQTQKATTLLEAVGGAKPSRELLAAYVQAVTSDDPLAAGKFVKGLMTPGWWGRVQTLRIAGLLSSTVTHFANMVGNVTQVPLEVATHGMVVGIDWARAKATGGERQAYMGELGPMLEAYGPGFASSMPDAIKILQTGVTPADAANLANIRPGIASGSGKVDAVLEGPLRALQAEDELFRGGAFAMQANRVATRYAIREGFQGAQLKGRAANIIKNLEDYPELYKEAHDAMLRMVFQEHRDWIPAPRGPVRGVVSQPLPFIKTPANITAQGMGLSPFGLASTIEAVRARGALQAGGTATQAQLGRATLLAEQRIARTALGTAILGMGVGLGAGTFTAGKSMLTGAYDPNEASTYPQGWREWSVVTEDPVSGNTYYVPMQNFGAAGAPLAMAAILTDAGKRGHSLLDQDEAARAATSIGQYVLDNTFLQGLSDTVNVLHDPTRYANKFLESLVSSYGPFSALGRQVQRAYGVASRNPHDGLMGLVEAMESNYPGLSGNVPESLTAIGEPRTQGISGGAAFALPVRADILRDEPTLAALRQNDVRIPPPAKAVNVGNGWSVDLTPEEQDQLERARGVAIRDWVARMQAMPAYQKGDLGTRNLYLSKAVSNASQQADVDFYRSLPRSDIRAQADGGRAVRRTVPTPYTVAGEESAA